MEWNFFSLRMRSPPLPLPGLCVLSSSVRLISSRSVEFHKVFEKRSMSLFGANRLNSTSCALRIDDFDGFGSQKIITPFCWKKMNPAARFVKRQRNTPRAVFDSSRKNFLTPSRSDEEDERSEVGGILVSSVKRGDADSYSKERLKRYSGMLRSSALKGSLYEGKAVHGHLIRNAIHPDAHLWNCLVNLYSKCGSFHCARVLLGKMPAWDVVSWTALIAGFVAQEDGSEAVALFCDMYREGVRPNEFTFATVLKACCMYLALNFGKQVHAEVIKIGFLSDIYVGSSLVDLYAKVDRMELAERVFFCMPAHNSVSWNALLNGYVRTGNEEEVLRLFNKMTESETRLSKFTLSCVLKGCANTEKEREGRMVHSLVIRSGCESDEILSSSLVDMYSKCGLAEDAYKIFIRIDNPDVVAWSAMIACLGQQGYSYKAAELFDQMKREGVRPNQFTLASIVSAATELDDFRYCKSIHACIWKLYLINDNSVNNALITMYMKFGSVSDGCRVFETMTNRDLVSWNALLSGFHDGDACSQGPIIFIRFLREGLKPNEYTFVSILRSCTSLFATDFGKQVHGYIIKNSLDGDSFVGSALIDMYAKYGCLEEVGKLFKRVDKKNLFTWTVVITGYAKNNHGEVALKYFRQMQREGVDPNEYTLASCLRGCSSITALENGRQLHSRVIKTGHLGDLFVSSALVDMYGKCGCIEDAEAVFDGLASWDIVSWNTIICGHSQHGHGNKALEAYQSMLAEGIMPDEVTFIGVLSACSHMGLVDEGKRHFTSLSKTYGISPTIEHHACMVDILGRAGRLDEVKSFIENMTLTPNALIWQTVLGACRMHADVDLAERVADKLFELEPEEDANYILLSNIYAAKGRWEDVANVRLLMASRGVKKEPGCSWVEVEGKFHVFLPQDGSHPRIKEINLKLEELFKKLASAGYIPDTKHVLHDVSDKNKIENLLHHSERLAVAFALLSTTHGRPIRVFKNLRICGDCHNVMKLISEISRRDIIIRDINHFHHFHSGSCSCQDYW